MPPKEYLADCKITYLEAEKPTNGDVVRLAEDRKYDVIHCNADKAAIRAWYDGYEQACGIRCKQRKERE